jgi:hypothetical protein
MTTTLFNLVKAEEWGLALCHLDSIPATSQQLAEIFHTDGEYESTPFFYASSAGAPNALMSRMLEIAREDPDQRNLAAITGRCNMLPLHFGAASNHITCENIRLLIQSNPSSLQQQCDHKCDHKGATPLNMRERFNPHPGTDDPVMDLLRATTDALSRKDYGSLARLIGKGGGDVDDIRYACMSKEEIESLPLRYEALLCLKLRRDYPAMVIGRDVVSDMMYRLDDVNCELSSNVISYIGVNNDEQCGKFCVDDLLSSFYNDGRRMKLFWAEGMTVRDELRKCSAICHDRGKIYKK